MAHPYALTDDHEPIDIIERAIFYSNSQNVIVAEDNISQLLTFRTEREQEGIDLSKKSFFFDYISLADGELHNTPLQTPAIERLEEDTTEYILIEVPILYEYTVKAGSLKFAISATESVLTPEGDEPVGTGDRQYVWQTLPSTLTIKPNLGKRHSVPNIQNVTTDYEGLITTIDTLAEDVDAIITSDVYNADAGEDNNGEVILDGGTPTGEGE